MGYRHVILEVCEGLILTYILGSESKAGKCQERIKQPWQCVPTAIVGFLFESNPNCWWEKST